MTGKKIPLIYSPEYDADIGPHIFRTAKFRALRDALHQAVPNSFIFLEPPEYSRADFSGFFTPEYEEDLFSARESIAMLRSELPVSREIIHWQLLSAMGTYRAAQEALQTGIAGHLGGGLHHACPDHAEGFCYVNDLAYAVWRLLKEQRITKALIVDCDLHQGNGTAEYFKNDPRVFTFSIHDEYNYPIPKSKSTLDIGLLPGTSGAEYCSRLQQSLESIFTAFLPDIALYQAGVDPYVRDQLGNLNLTAEDLKERDYIVLNALHSRRIPVVITLGGGYPPTLEELVNLHAQTFFTALALYSS